MTKKIERAFLIKIGKNVYGKSEKYYDGNMQELKWCRPMTFNNAVNFSKKFTNIKDSVEIYRIMKVNK